MEKRELRRDPNVGKIIDRTIVRLWETIEELEQLTPPELAFYRVAIFGSARVQRGDALYNDVKLFAEKITDLGCDIVTGGGPGLMEAANEGAHGRGNGKTRSFGLTIASVPSEEHPNPYVDRVTAHRTFFSRLHHFVRMSHAFVIFPGGIGTALETFMIWQLLQVHLLRDRPFLLCGGMWDGLIDWMRREMLSRNNIEEEDLAIPTRVSSISEAVAIIEESKAQFDGERERLLAGRLPGRAG
jgi:uncharacterized protein (TIGR00730 family)